MDALRNKDEAALRKELVDLARERFNLRMRQAEDSAAVKSSEFKKLRRTIARIQTLLKEKSKLA